MEFLVRKTNNVQFDLDSSLLIWLFLTISFWVYPILGEAQHSSTWAPLHSKTSLTHHSMSISTVNSSTAYPNRKELSHVLGLDSGGSAQITPIHGVNAERTDSTVVNRVYRNALRIGILNPFFENLHLAYERNVHPKGSFELAVGIIGASYYDWNTESSGIYGKIGYRIFLTTKRSLEKSKGGLLHCGWYLRPEVSYAHYSDLVSETNRRIRVDATAAMLNIGRQTIWDNKTLMESYVGVGLGYSGQNKTSVHYAFIGGTNDLPIVFAIGWRLGIPF
jgi:hypothetical protein